MKFEVGDKVRAFGCDGVVSEVWDAATNGLNITVQFNNGKDVEFTSDGKLKDWHKEPSLQLIEKAKKKKTIVLREALFLIDGGYNTVMCDNEYVSDIHGFITWIEGGRVLEVEVNE